MADEPENPQPQGSSPTTKIAVLIFAAATAVAPFTLQSEGTVHKAYRDPVGIWTICNGHTGADVHPGLVLNDQQCHALYVKDMSGKMKLIIQHDPEITAYPNLLKAAGDISFNGGQGAWFNSPMVKSLKHNQYPQLCSQFVGYYTGATYPKAQAGMKCVPHPGKPGKWLCELPGLVKRRIGESKLCVTGKWE